MEVPVCEICKDPICSFICPECLAEDIREWLPKELSRDFEKFNNTFLRYFGNNEELLTLHCIRCKKIKNATVCLFCYIFTVSEWLEKRDKNISNQLTRMFLLGSGRVIDNDGNERYSDMSSGTIETKPKKTKDRCEFCEEYSERLINRDGKRVCESCFDWWSRLTSAEIVHGDYYLEYLLKDSFIKK